jgi:hypothetical protein
MPAFLDLTDASSAQWFRLPVPGVEEDQRPSLLIRPLSTSERQAIYYQVWGRKQKIRVRPGYRIATDDDNRKGWRQEIATAAAALVDSRDLSLSLPPEQAAKLSELLGEPIESGAFVLLDGKLSKVLVREMLVEFLAEVRPAIVRWIEAKSAKLAALDADEEEELGKTSATG